MNFLAHALLAELPAAKDAPDDTADRRPPGGDAALLGRAVTLRVGGVVGDFIKGLLPGELPADLAEGVALHRAIDSYADRHPAFARSRQRFPAAQRRWAGVIVDVFYDHLLARDWVDWHDESLSAFTRQVYADLARCDERLPAAAQLACRRMAAQDWLSAYASFGGLAETLARMGARVARENPLAGAETVLRADDAGFTADFAVFFTDARAFAANWINAQASRSGAATARDPARPDAG